MNRFRSVAFLSIIDSLFFTGINLAVNRFLSNSFSPRPLVVVEDRVYHISELLGTIQRNAPGLLSNLTIVCLDRAGPDTDAAIQDWLDNYPELQVASRIGKQSLFSNQVAQLESLNDNLFSVQHDYCRKIACFIRKRGLLVQDIDLESLSFIPRERWWDTTMLASTVRGIVGERAPKCAFISNKRGYEATFGSELLAAGHDPRDVMNKYEMERVVVPFLERHVNSYFPWKLRWLDSSNQSGLQSTNHDAEEKREIESELDIVLWPEQNQFAELGGKSFAPSKKSPLLLAAVGNEAITWSELIASRLQQTDGVEVQAVGKRVAPEGALRAEVTNAAARHIHSLRKRLSNPKDIVTVQGHYRLADELSVGWIET